MAKEEEKPPLVHSKEQKEKRQDQGVGTVDNTDT